MKLAYIHPQDVNDKNLWSGTVYFIYQGIKKKFDDVILLSPINEKFILIKYLCRILEYVSTKLTGKQQINLYSSYLLSVIQGRIVDKFVKEKHIDCIVSATTAPFISTKNKVPLCLITDATVRLLYEEYSDRKGWSDFYYKDLEKNALKVSQKSALIISSSSATTNSLINDYDIPSSKVVTIPFGANIEEDDIQFRRREIDANKPIYFLFVGKDWERKGGDIAISICDMLVQQNVNVQLNIVGCKIPEKAQRPYVKSYNYLNKNMVDDAKKLRELYKEAHFLSVFSKAEMFGLVFCEAAAYGLPSITFAVGGIVDIVINNETGIALSIDSKIEDFAIRISELISKPVIYQEMSSNARRRYDALLNWDVFSESLKNEIYKRFN